VGYTWKGAPESSSSSSGEPSWPGVAHRWGSCEAAPRGASSLAPGRPRSGQKHEGEWV
jgi:hypothetical protein